MEEIVVTDGHVRNPSFTPYGLRGVGEPPTISSGPAIAAAVRAASGKKLRRVPIRPEHITET
jgi:CO/xanthine dehydrogenase Mo-binding subunit